jgi:hypothetical protein
MASRHDRNKRIMGVCTQTVLFRLVIVDPLFEAEASLHDFLCGEGTEISPWYYLLCHSLRSKRKDFIGMSGDWYSY